jgi:hypothetical protein
MKRLSGCIVIKDTNCDSPPLGAMEDVMCALRRWLGANHRTLQGVLLEMADLQTLLHQKST